MPRKPLIRSADYEYHVTNRSNNREWFYLPIEGVWKVFTEVLGRTIGLYGIEIRLFVLMANHYHLILRTPENNLSHVVRYLQSEVARGIQNQTGRINHIFGGRYKWSLLWNESAYAFAYKYVARNPVVAGTCLGVTNYPFSTINTIDKGLRDEIAVTEKVFPVHSLVPLDWDSRVKWLDLPSPRELDALVSKALRRYTFAFSQGNEVRKKLIELSRHYAIPLPEEEPPTFSAEKWFGTDIGLAD